MGERIITEKSNLNRLKTLISSLYIYKITKYKNKTFISNVGTWNKK